jgi:hypothetical protein
MFDAAQHLRTEVYLCRQRLPLYDLTIPCLTCLKVSVLATTLTLLLVELENFYAAPMLETNACCCVPHVSKRMQEMYIIVGNAQTNALTILKSLLQSFSQLSSCIIRTP